MWEAVDPDGRRVVLEWAGWSHIMRRHPYFGITAEDVVDIVASPDERVTGRAEGKEWFYRRGVGPSSWARVVVHFEGGRGLVVTAYPRRSFP